MLAARNRRDRSQGSTGGGLVRSTLGCEGFVTNIAEKRGGEEKRLASVNEGRRGPLRHTEVGQIDTLWGRSVGGAKRRENRGKEAVRG